MFHPCIIFFGRNENKKFASKIYRPLAIINETADIWRFFCYFFTESLFYFLEKTRQIVADISPEKCLLCSIDQSVGE